MKGDRKMNRISFSVFCFLILVFLSYQKFYVKASNVEPDKDYYVIIDQKTDKYGYNKNIHLDGNLDGKITVGEQKRAYNYIQQSIKDGSYREKLEFVSKLDDLDRRLIQGLSYETAKKVVKIPTDLKYDLANYNLPMATKVNQINSIYKK